jgi:1-acyl-sn-glycerol-3-phosphate acyltransferase
MATTGTRGERDADPGLAAAVDRCGRPAAFDGGTASTRGKHHVSARRHSGWARAAIVVAYVAAFWVALPLALWRLGSWCDGHVPVALEPSPGGWIVVASGGALMLASILALGVRGRGLPVSALPPPRLVVSGPYRWVRHPVYVGFHLVVVGVGWVIGSAGLALVVGAALLPAWVGYALVEERGLRRRFGAAYRNYQHRVGLLPRLDVYRLTQLLARVALPVRVDGRARVPRTGAAVLVANHACYADPVFLQCVTRRHIHFLATAEAFRGGALAWALRRTAAVPLRRYRVDAAATRELLRRLDEGALVGVFVEGERSPLGSYQGSLPQVARVLGQLAVPVIPVGISDNYDAGPRWADRLRVRPVRVRIGAPVSFGAVVPARALDAAIGDLLDEDPQRVHLDGLDREKLGRVLWRCPTCLDEERWRPAELRCAACGAAWEPTTTGKFRDAGDPSLEVALAELARPVWLADEPAALGGWARGAHERSVFGPIGPLDPLGEDRLEITPRTLRFGGRTIPLTELRSTSTERTDTLQVATADEMWQFRLREGSVFRLQRAIDRWRGKPGFGGDPFLAEASARSTTA